tara:strand:+ start:942 stop:1274 length:333 start_codon:yes stop_codon:yes gene_type:complete
MSSNGFDKEYIDNATSFYSKAVNIGDNCVYCLKDTSFGSGRFVNRIPASTNDYDGYACPECMETECDRCDDMIGLDEDITVDTPTRTERVHWECLTHKEKVGYKLNGGSV